MEGRPLSHCFKPTAAQDIKKKSKQTLIPNSTGGLCCNQKYADVGSAFESRLWFVLRFIRRLACHAQTPQTHWWKRPVHILTFNTIRAKRTRKEVLKQRRSQKASPSPVCWTICSIAWFVCRNVLPYTVFVSAHDWFLGILQPELLVAAHVTCSQIQTDWVCITIVWHSHYGNTIPVSIPLYNVIHI